MSTYQRPAANGRPRQATPAGVLADAALLRRALRTDAEGQDAPPGDGAMLVVLSGLPGTGKSHFARELTKLVPFLVLESDRVRKLLTANPRYTPAEHARVFAVCHLLIEEYLAQGRRVLFDATNLSESFRRPLYVICDRLSVPLTILRFTAPRQVVRRRLEERALGLHPEDNSDANWLIYCRLSPAEEQIRRQHLTVDSSGDISPVVKHVAQLAGHPAWNG